MEFKEVIFCFILFDFFSGGNNNSNTFFYGSGWFFIDSAQNILNETLNIIGQVNSSEGLTTTIHINSTYTSGNGVFVLQTGKLSITNVYLSLQMTRTCIYTGGPANSSFVELENCIAEYNETGESFSIILKSCIYF
jgi:hypothetical protein